MSWYTEYYSRKTPSISSEKREEEGEGGGEEESEGEGEGEGEEMERMLGELTLISPPNTAPLGDSLSSDGGRESESQMDTLAIMRKKLLDMTEGPENPTSPDADTTPHKTCSTAEESRTEIEPTSLSVMMTAISIEPPTPTAAAGETVTLRGEEERGVRHSASGSNRAESLLAANGLNSGRLKLGHFESGRSEDDLLPSTTGGGGGGGGGEGDGVKVMGTRGRSPCFSPASLHASPSDSVTVRTLPLSPSLSLPLPPPLSVCVCM